MPRGVEKLAPAPVPFTTAFAPLPANIDTDPGELDADDAAIAAPDETAGGRPALAAALPTRTAANNARASTPGLRGAFPTGPPARGVAAGDTVTGRGRAAPTPDPGTDAESD